MKTTTEINKSDFAFTLREKEGLYNASGDGLVPYAQHKAAELAVV